VDYRVVPRVIFTDPEAAFVGLSEAQAKRRGLRYDVARFPVQDIDRAATEGDNEGLIRILIVKGKIAGASMVAPHAGEMIHELALAMQVNARIRAISGLIHAYPTWSQLHRRAVNAHYSGLLYSGKARLLARLLNRVLP
jgi:pyruvate/2-oxoglutarate dehydrogenase complex dihydrolipoamide dehydrogenase (E3) component